MIYLDYSATTPLDREVAKKMQPYFSDIFANPASIHSLGQRALKAVDDARYSIAAALHVSGNEIIFTSGATEANNLAIKGIVEEYGHAKSHIITSTIEHDSILEPCNYLKKRGAAITSIGVDSKGLLKPEAIIAAIRPETVLISIGYVNSEVGTVQPIKKIGRILKNYNERMYKTWLNTSPRKRGSKPRHVYLHTDATQAANFFDCRPEFLHCDLLSLSSHKIYGPKGAGLLYCRSGLPLHAMLHGGHQERNLRSGTLNVPAIVGFGAAFTKALREQAKNNARISKLRRQLATAIQKLYPKTTINTPFEQASPSHLNISFMGWDGEALLSYLDEQGIAVSTGSACASGSLSASHVLLAMGRSESQARSTLRITVGKLTAASEIAQLNRALKNYQQPG